jgi:hypothetical protein
LTDLLDAGAPFDNANIKNIVPVISVALLSKYYFFENLIRAGANINE